MPRGADEDSDGGIQRMSGTADGKPAAGMIYS